MKKARNDVIIAGFFHIGAAVVYLRFMKKINSRFSSVCSNRAFPVCLANAWKSLTEPVSVAITRKTSPLNMSARAFLVFRIGRGSLIGVMKVNRILLQTTGEYRSAPKVLF